MNKEYKRFWIVLSLLTLFRLFFIGQVELSPDEAYYWTWSRHLDWSYFDQGPMLALIIGFFTTLFHASTEWTVRFGSVFLSVITSWVYFKLLESSFKNSRIAWYGFLTFQATLLMSAGAVMMMHDSIMMCFWIVGMYFFYKALFEDWTAGWWTGALALGLGALSKYTMAMFVPCLLLFLLLSPAHRKWWKKPHLYIAGFITLLLISPIIFWNMNHGWASFGHVGDLGGVEKKTVFSLQTTGIFLAGQLGVMSPLIALFCFAAPMLGWREWKKNTPHSAPYLFFLCFSAPVLYFFLLLSCRTDVYANWPAPGYPAAIAIIVALFIHLRKTAARPALIRWTGAISLGFAALLTLLAYGQILFSIIPLQGNAARSVDRIHGWREMGKATAQMRDKFERESGQKVFLATRRYQLAGLLSFYTPGQPEVQLLPRVEPANNQYRFWNHENELAGENALYVSEYFWEMDHIKNKFEHVLTLDPYPIIKNGRKIRDIRFFFAYNFHPKAPKQSSELPGTSKP